MKVIWINRSEWRKPGPIVYIGLLNALSFARTGLETHFFVSAGEDSDTEKDLDTFYGTGGHPNLTIHRVPRGGKLEETFGRKVYRKGLRLAGASLKRGEPVVLLSRELGLTPLMARLQGRYPTLLRTAYEAHDFHARLDHLEAPRFTDRRKQATEKLFLKNLSGVLCITREQETLYRAALPGLNTRALSLGCLNFDSPPSAGFQRRSAAYIGHLHGSKGVQNLVKLAPRLHQHGISLHLIGGKPEQGEKLIRKLPPELRGATVRHVPHVPPAELHTYFQEHIGAGVVPLRDTFYNRNLTCPVKALDSLAHGLPVIASDLPSTREVLGDAALYSDPAAPEQLLENLIRLFESEADYARLANAARERRAQLQWPDRARAILDWLEPPGGKNG